jgi:hypothetical protein
MRKGVNGNEGNKGNEGAVTLSFYLWQIAAVDGLQVAPAQDKGDEQRADDDDTGC